MREAPSSVSIITADEIRRYGWRTLGDALRSLRGFYTSYDRQYVYLGVRGFLRPGDYNCRILLLLNGHRLNENVFDSAPMGTEFPLDLDLVDHIEVVRGPGSSLFGANAVFGVINVITRRAVVPPAIEVSGDVSSFLGRTGRVTAFGTKGRLSMVLSGSPYRDPGHSRLYFPEFDSPATNNGYAEDMDGTDAHSVFADVQYANVRLLALISDRAKSYPTASYGAAFNDPADRLEDRRGFVDLSYHRSLPAQTDLDARVYYDAYSSFGTGAYEDVPGRVLGASKAEAGWAGGEVNLDRRMGKHRVAVGGTYEYNLGITQKNYVFGQPPFFLSDESSWLAAAYSEVELSLAPKLRVNAGGRFDWYSTFGGALSPRVAFIYSPASRTTLKYIFGRAFRAPNAYEEYYRDGVAITAAPGQLKPEKIQSHEIVVEHSFVPWLSVTADGYYNQLEKLIDQVPDPNTGLTYFVNSGRVHSKGLEFEVLAQHSSGVAARASYTLSRAADDVSRTSSANSPLSQAKLNATVPMWGRGFTGVELLYSGAMQDYRGTRVPPYLLTNLTLSSRPLWGGWDFSASCYNALNRRWFSPMGPNDPEAAILQDGRTYRFKVSYRLPLGGHR